jgi:quinolinate synthase
MRKKYPDAKVIVHPESTKDVVDNSDDSGSTEYILKKIAASEDGSSWIVGTESTFVKRLAVEFPTKKYLYAKRLRMYKHGKNNTRTFA